MRVKACYAALVGLVVAAQAAPVPAPDYLQMHLHYVYPAGAQAGQTITVEFGGGQGLAESTGLLIEGPPGIEVRDWKVFNYGNDAKAELVIAEDAVPSRRLLRVIGGPTGLTYYRSFWVGRLPERAEKEPNNSPEQATEVSLPAVVNGRLAQPQDEDCFRFAGKAGQKLTARIWAHGIDSRGPQSGFFDSALELLDAQGHVLAEADDDLGMDPLLHLTLPADGTYVVRVKSPTSKGAAWCVYRLLLGEVACPTALFPPGGQRGQTVAVELSGPGVAAGSMAKVAVTDEAAPVQRINPGGDLDGLVELPFVRGRFPEIVETEPNNDRATATPLSLPGTANGRFLNPGDEDWYRLTVKDLQPVVLEVVAQRLLQSPIDTLLEVYDPAGKLLAQNDDSPLVQGPFQHDFAPFDSGLTFKPPQAGEYFVRVSENSGIRGPRSVYRLTARHPQPDFELFHWPDVVPIWGPGTTASLAVEYLRHDGLTGDIELTVEGLPPGWRGSMSWLPANEYRAPVYEGTVKAVLTITAPADAPVGTRVPFRVVGRLRTESGVLERTAQPLNMYELNFLSRPSSTALAVVARPRGFWLETDMHEVTAQVGQTVEVPVRVAGVKPGDDISLVVNRFHYGVASSMGVPQTFAPAETIRVPLTIPPELAPGTYGIVVARTWRSDVRVGLPGPCTPVIRLVVTKKP